MAKRSSKSSNSKRPHPMPRKAGVGTNKGVTISTWRKAG